MSKDRDHWRTSLNVDLYHKQYSWRVIELVGESIHPFLQKKMRIEKVLELNLLWGKMSESVNCEPSYLVTRQELGTPAVEDKHSKPLVRSRDMWTTLNSY